MSRIREVKLTDTLDVPINPATEETLQTLIGALGGGGSITNLTFKESKILAGDAYFISHSQKIKKNKVLNVVISTPATPIEIHFDRNTMISVSEEAEVKVYVGMTTTGSLGTPVTIINANANSTNVSPAPIFVDPTGNINKGLFVYKEIIGEHSRVIPGRGYIILRSNTNYLMEIKSKKDHNVVNVPFEFFTNTP